MWIEALREVRNPGRERFEIRDAEGQLLLVLPFSEIIERGNGARRPPPSFGALMEAMERTRSLQADVGAQIDIAWNRIREARQALAVSTPRGGDRITRVRRSPRRAGALVNFPYARYVGFRGSSAAELGHGGRRQQEKSGRRP